MIYLNQYKLFGNFSCFSNRKREYHTKKKCDYACGPVVALQIYQNDFKLNWSNEYAYDQLAKMFDILPIHSGGIYEQPLAMGLSSWSCSEYNHLSIYSNKGRKRRYDDNSLYEKCIKFIDDRLSNGYFVGFLNKDKWHWTTIISGSNGEYTIVDNCRTKQLDFKNWYFKGTKQGALIGKNYENQK